MIIPNFTTCDTHRKEGRPILPSLVVCRDFGARGLTVCKLIRSYLSKFDESGEWQLYAHAAHEAEANHEAFLRLVSSSYQEEDESIQRKEEITKLIEAGHGIFVGESEVEASMAAKNAFRVRLTGSMSHRIKWLSIAYGLDVATARLCILSHEESRRCRPMVNGQPVEHPLHYHLTLNTDDLSEILICRLIADSLMEWWEEQRQIYKVLGSYPNTSERGAK